VKDAHGANRTKEEKSRLSPKDPTGQRGQISFGFVPCLVSQLLILGAPGIRFFPRAKVCGRQRPDRILAADKISGCAPGLWVRTFAGARVRTIAANLEISACRLRCRADQCRRRDRGRRPHACGVESARPLELPSRRAKIVPFGMFSAILRPIPHKSSRSGSFYGREAVDLTSRPYREIRRLFGRSCFQRACIKTGRALAGREIKHGPSCDGPRGILECRRTREPVIRRRAGAPQAR